MSREYPQHPRIGVAVVIFCGDEALLIKRAKDPAKGLYSIPGGTLRLGEGIEAAARREVLEETGLTLGALTFVTFVERVERDQEGAVRFHYVIFDFTTKLTERPTVQASSDAEEARWVKRADLPSLPTTEGLSEVLQEAARQSLAAW